jgi:hypothetical protein
VKYNTIHVLPFAQMRLVPQMRLGIQAAFKRAFKLRIQQLHIQAALKLCI